MNEEDTYTTRQLQGQINSGIVWRLGSLGRAAMDAISAGHCMLGLTGKQDYWGNYIPSRDQVKAGTKGSYQFVAEINGTEYADSIAAE